ncbi:MAG: hypothetical protein JOZ19_13315 [Rubrobacter sp.]|nr:hypothetical protein [Rubrobacter sp.]
MSRSNLTQWSCLAAVVAGGLFVTNTLITLLILLPAQGSLGEAVWLFRLVIAQSATVLLLVGVVGLYAYQAGAAGNLGLISFLVTFSSLVLAQSFIWATWLVSLGWALFGISSMQARVYPSMAAIVLIIGAVGAGTAGVLLSGGTSSFLLVYVSASSSVVLNTAIAWLGYSSFTKRAEEA